MLEKHTERTFYKYRKVIFERGVSNEICSSPGTGRVISLQSNEKIIGIYKRERGEFFKHPLQY